MATTDARGDQRSEGTVDEMVDRIDELKSLDLHNRFHYHKPSLAGALTHETLADQFEALANVIATVVPGGRERSLALTKLEESKFWASAGVARNPETR